LAENTVFATSCSGGLRTDRVHRGPLEREGRAVPAEGDEGSVEVVCLGQPYPEAELRVVDDARGALGERHVGEIELRSPSLMTGYFDDPDETGKALADGWLRTGDRGYMANGELYLVGRSKDLIIVGGRNLAPQDVERTVETVAGVRPGNVAAFGIPSERGTEQVGVIA
jgi:acyl-CoA synthetase (AMP-forming)/AMP-acid ligase II